LNGGVNFGGVVLDARIILKWFLGKYDESVIRKYLPHDNKTNYYSSFQRWPMFIGN
jgi:hypothetical protein